MSNLAELHYYWHLAHVINGNESQSAHVFTYWIIQKAKHFDIGCLETYVNKPYSGELLSLININEQFWTF